MIHVAIMKKSWGMLPKILTGEKKIESRWYKSKHLPWGRISSGDVIYFKNSGGPVCVRADVEKITTFSGLTPQKVKRISNEFGKDLGIKEEKVAELFRKFKDKNYCLLIFLKNPEKVEPFEVSKTGFGMLSSWLTVESIDRIKV